MTTISFKASKREFEAIDAIAQRAVALAVKLGVQYSIQEAMMDITATHANGNPLRLFDLAAADEFNFGHDVFGIRRHIDRTTGKLGDCFVPRFSERQTEAA